MTRSGKTLLIYSLLLLILLGVYDCDGKPRKGADIAVFAGSIIKPVMDELGSIYEQDTGIKVIITYGGSGAVLSQMKLAQYGDIYMPASSDFMDKAKKDGLIIEGTERTFVYLIPAINVQKGNPKNITGLEDLARPGLKVAIANPDSVVIGVLAKEIMEKNGLSERIQPNIVAFAESAEKLQSMLVLKTVDAVIGWRDFQNWTPQYIHTILITPGQLTRISYTSAAISRFTSDRPRAEAFLSFLTSDRAKSVFLSKGYIINEEEAGKYIKN